MGRRATFESVGPLERSFTAQMKEKKKQVMKLVKAYISLVTTLYVLFQYIFLD